MHQFSVPPISDKNLRRQLTRGLVFVFVAILASYIIVHWLLDEEFTNVDTSAISTTCILLPMLGFILYNGLKKNRAVLATYKLTITDQSVSREMMNYPHIVIDRNDIRKIIKNVDGAISIVGNNKLNAIGVPAQIENKKQLEALLNTIIPLTVKTSASWHERYPFVLVIAIVTLTFSVFFLENNLLLVAAGVISVSFFVYCMVVVHQSKNFDTRTKRISFIFIIPILSMIGFVILKWMN